MFVVKMARAVWSTGYGGPDLWIFAFNIAETLQEAIMQVKTRLSWKHTQQSCEERQEEEQCQKERGGETVGIRLKTTNSKIYLKNPSILKPDCLRKSLKIKPWLLAQTWATACHSLYFQAHHAGCSIVCRCQAAPETTAFLKIGLKSSKELIRAVMSL